MKTGFFSKLKLIEIGDILIGVDESFDEYHRSPEMVFHL